MAQVIRKFLSGGKPKPVIIKVDGKDRNYDDIERDVWGNFDTYAQQQGWNNATLLAVREYLDYALPGLKQGSLTYGHNTMNGVSEDWLSDGSFNTSGRGIFKKDITTDKRAGATLGTAYLNRLFTDIIPEYKAPELKNIGNQITLDVVKKIVDSNFGGNESAFTEGWARLTPLDRYTIFRLAISDLNYDEDEYKDVATFNTNRDLLLQALGDRYDETNGLNLSILDAYSKFGGYGLELLIKGLPKTEETTDTVTAPTMDDMRKKWREEAINAGYHTDQAIADYIATKEMEYNQLQSLPGTVLKKMLDLDLFTKAHESLDNYIKNSKGLLWKNYRFNRGGVDIDNEKLKRGDNYNFSKFSESSFRNQIKLLSLQLRLGKVNAFMWRGVLNRLMSHPEAFLNLLYEYKDGSGRGCYIIPGTEDMDSESVITYTTTGGLAIKSIHDFPELYANRFNNKFRELYKQQYNFDLPEDWDILLGTAIASAKELSDTQVLQNKNGGILKAQDGTAFTHARMSLSGSFDLENNYWKQVHQLDAQKQSLEIDEANKLGVTVEELRKLKAETAKKQAKIDAAVKHGQSTVEGFTNYDWANVAGAGFDILETVGSLVGGAADPITWAGGIGSLISYTTADVLDPRVSKWGVAKNVGINTGLSLLGLIPEFGAAAPVARTAKVLTRYAPKLLLAFLATQTLPEAYNATKKLTEKGFSSLTNDELLAIARGIQTLSAGTRTAKQTRSEFRASKPGEGKTTIEIQSESKGRQSLELKPEQYDKIKGKTAKLAEEILGKDVLGDAHVVEGSKKYWIAGLKKPVITNEGTSWYSRHIGNRKLKSVDELKSNERRDWLRALALPMNQRSLRFYDWRHNLKTPSWMPNFSRQPMSDELFGQYNRQPGNKLATVEGLGVKTVSLVNATELRARNRAARALKKATQSEEVINLPVLFPEPVRVISKNNPEITNQVRILIERGLVPPYFDGRTRSPQYDFSRVIFPQNPLINIPRLSIPRLSTPMMLPQRTISRGNVSKLLRGENKTNFIKQVQEKLKNKDTVFAVTKEGDVILATKNTNLQIISPNTKVKVKKGKSEVEMTISDAMAQGYEIKFNKFGGFISRVISAYQQGGNIVGNVSSNNSSWHDLIFSLYFNNLYEGLKSGKFTLDDINAMQDRHLKLWAEYDPNKGAYVGKDNVVGGYQKDIIDKYGFVNLNGINNGWKNNRYSTVLNRSYNTDHDNATGNYLADNVFGGLTDDRRILGRNGDFTQEQLLNYNNKLKDLGLEIYLDDNGTNSGSAYYKLRKLQDSTSGNQSNGLLSSNGLSNNSLNHTFVDPITGETLERQPDGTYKAVGNDNAQTKSQISKVGEDIWKYVQNINPADAIALGRALWGEDVNNKVADITKKMGVALLDPQHETAILHGNYNAKMLAELLAGKINAAALKPISSDAGTQLAGKLEAAMKATEALRQGNLEDSEMYWKTLQILNLVNNENAANEVATGNENRSRVTAAANNRLQVEAARLAANFEQIWNPYFSGIELNMRNEDTLRRQAEIDSWKYSVTDKYQKLNDETMERYRTARLAAIENWKNSHTGSDGKVNWDGFDEYWATDANGSRKYLKELQDISRAMHKELYEGLSGYYNGYTPFILKRAPETTLTWRTPGINGNIRHFTASNKSGGTLSAADRQALKTTNEINKNIRAANRETFSNIRQDKREHRKAMALVSLLSADLIKKAIGIK